MGPATPGDLTSEPKSGGRRGGIPAVLRASTELLCSYLAAVRPTHHCEPPPGQARYV